jgi:hypothetical protein
MIRNLLGFALFAVIALFLLKLVFGGLFILAGLIFLALKLALFGFLIYLVLRLVAPETAARVREAVRGH